MKDLAREVFSAGGWLSRQPADFRAEVLQRGIVQNFARGEAIYRLGDPPGGSYGLITGSFAVTTAPVGSMPRLVHFGAPGHWIGEGPFLSGEPRRVELRAAMTSLVLHLPLDAMEQMAAGDPLVARRFGQIALLNVDVAIRIIHDLLIPGLDRRLAAVLVRAAGIGVRPIPLSQSELGAMSNATRKQVNAALGRLAARGWLTAGYRAIAVLDVAALQALAEGGD